MISFLSPTWFLALGGLLVPIILHLISRGRTRRVRVPSLRLLSGNDSSKARRIKPTQLLLLAVRCLLLASLAAALAGPRWPSPAGADRPDWVLIAPALLEQRAALENSGNATLASNAFAQLDALDAAGAELRLLQPGFPTVGTSASAPAHDLTDVWSLLREADVTAPKTAGFHVLVVDHLEQLRGVRPTLSRAVEWIPVPAPGHNAWIEGGGVIRSDGGDTDADAVLTVMVGHSDAGQTTFTRRQVTPAATATSDVIWTAGNKLQLTAGDAVEQDDQAPLRPERQIQVAVFHDAERDDDARYVRAALAAASTHALVPTQLVDAALGDSDTGEDSDGQLLDVIFWLAESPLPDQVLSRLIQGGIAVSDGGPLYEACSGNMTTGTGPIALRRCSPAPDEGAGVPVWTDGAGRTLLDAVTLATTAKGPRAATRYRFHGRFHPAWSDLPTHPAFPAWVMELLQRAGSPTARLLSSEQRGSDLRSSSTQGAPRVERVDRAASATAAYSQAPRFLLWIIVALLLVAERFLATRTHVGAVP